MRKKNPSNSLLLKRAVIALESVNAYARIDSERYWLLRLERSEKLLAIESSRLVHEREKHANETQALRHDLGKVAGVLNEVLNALVSAGQGYVADVLSSELQQKIKNLPPGLVDP